MEGNLQDIGIKVLKGELEKKDQLIEQLSNKVFQLTNSNGDKNEFEQILNEFPDPILIIEK